MPVKIIKLCRMNVNISVHNCIQCRFRQVLHLHEPLKGKPWFNNWICPFRTSYLVIIIFNPDQVPCFLKLFFGKFFCLKSVYTYKESRPFAHCPIFIEDINNRQLMSEANLVVINIVSRSNLQASCTKFRINITVKNKWYLTICHRDNNFFSFQMLVSDIIRMCTNSSISEYCFRTCSCDHYISFLSHYFVTDIIKFWFFICIINLFIWDRGHSLWIPVNHSYASVNKPLIKQIDKYFNYGIISFLIHREKRAVPVTWSAQPFKLFEDYTSMFMSPLPCMFQKLLTGKITFFNSFGFEFCNYFCFGSYWCMIGSRNPAGILPLHSCPSDQYILDSIVKHVTHVKYSCNVRWRNNNCIRLSFIRSAFEESIFHPVLVPPALSLPWLVFWRNIHCCLFVLNS